MSEKTIWSRLRQHGLTEFGTAAVMGNMMAESLLKANNVEDRCGISDEVYTAQVDNGSISAYRFAHDSYGYGLTQTTFYTRKEALLKFAKERGVSIGDEQMQVDFCIHELKTDYADLFNFLCTATNLLTATSKFCTEFERPAINNINVRYEFAVEFMNRNSGTDIGETEIAPEPQKQAQKATYTKITTLMPCLRKGSKGVAVMMMQIALITKKYLKGSADGDFGICTDAALKAFQQDNSNSLDVDGICGGKTWEKLYE